MSAAATRAWPVIGHKYVDMVAGRELLVTEINPGDPKGRDVVGLLSHTPRNGHQPRPYATALKIFPTIWEAT